MPSVPGENAELLSTYYRKPSQRLRDKIVTANMGLVRKTAHRFAATSLEPYEDLEQVGAMGLCKAVDGFDPTLGYTFATYAVPKIRSEIQHYLRDKTHPVKIPRAWSDRRRRFLGMVEAGEAPEAIAEATHVKPEDQAAATIALQYRPLVALDHSYSDSATPLIETIAGQVDGDAPVITIDDVLRWFGVECKSDWVNATRLCREEGKVFHEFVRLSSTQARIHALKNKGFSRIIHSSRGRRGGSWVHKALVPDFLIWVNPTKYQTPIMDSIIGNLEEV